MVLHNIKLNYTNIQNYLQYIHKLKKCLGTVNMLKIGKKSMNKTKLIDDLTKGNCTSIRDILSIGSEDF